MTGNPIQGRPCLLPTQVCVLSYRSTSFQRQDSTATAVRDRSLCVPSSHDGDTHRTSGFLGGWGRTAFRPWSPVTRATASSPVRSQEIRLLVFSGHFSKSLLDQRTPTNTARETARLAPQRCLPWFLFSEQRLLTSGMSASYYKHNKSKKKKKLKLTQNAKYASPLTEKSVKHWRSTNETICGA